MVPSRINILVPPKNQALIDPLFLTSRVDRYQERNRRNGTHILQGRLPGPEAVLLVFNDYLALANHAAIIEAQVPASIRGLAFSFRRAVAKSWACL